MRTYTSENSLVELLGCGAEQDGWHLACVRAGMEDVKPPRDSDPSEMTDFEKNTTQEELKQVVPPPDPTSPDPNRERQEHGNRGPDEEPGFGQGA